MDDSPKPDAFEKRLRFVCGFLFGGAISFLVIAQEVTDFTGVFWPSVAAAAIIFGILAMRYGDRFWRNIGDWLHWW